MTLSKRSAIDLVVLILTIAVASFVGITIVGGVIIKLVHPGTDLSKAAEFISTTVSTIVGALVGFIGGRAYGKSEANGATK
jgi:uncharacterized membrane protein YbhN (UPF0104 family)